MALPDYPVPQLETTLREASRVLQVCLSPEEYQQYIVALEQEKDALWDAHYSMLAMATGYENWATAQFKSHILSCRDPLHASTAIAVVLPTAAAATSGENAGVERVAALLWAAAKLHCEPWLVEGDEPTERTQQSEVFATSRLPGKTEDRIEVYPESLHAILLCASGIFPIQILSQSNPGGSRSPLPVHDIYCQVAEAASQPTAGTEHDPAPLCHLSSLPRQDWHTLREQILASGGAVAASLRVMETAVLAITLEDCHAPLHLADALNIVRLGRENGRCLRYYDKVVNIVTFQDGEAGIMFEHSALDGMVAALVTYSIWHVSETLSLDFTMQLPRSTHNPRNVPPPKPLDVDMTCLNLSPTTPPPIDTNLMVTFEMPSPKDFLKTLRNQRGLFDAWVSFSLQLALKKTIGDLANSYIFVAPSHMRHYKHGRCDPTYPITSQSINLVGALMSCADINSTPLYTKAIFHLFHLAFQEHKHLIKATKKGQSVGPHLAALRKALPLENSLRKFLDLFASPSVYITGKDIVEGMACAVGNVYAQDQLAVTYLGRTDRVSLALNGKGSFGSIIGQLQENFQESLKLVMPLALRYAIAAQMEALDCLLQNSEEPHELAKSEMDMRYSHQDMNKFNQQVTAPDSALRKNSDFTIIIHGGVMEEIQVDQKIWGLIDFSLQTALAIAAQELAAGGRSLNAVQKCVTCLEDCFLFKTGRGAMFNREGKHEREGTIVDGTGIKSGSVAYMPSVNNPIVAAQEVIKRQTDRLLVEDGVVEFLDDLGQEGDSVGAEYIHTNLWKDFTAEGINPKDSNPQTVGAVALDQGGGLAAATSIGGMAEKRTGQTGEEAVVGAEIFADKTIAVTCCGHGELLLRHTAAQKVAHLYHHMGYSLREACQKVLSVDLRGCCAGIIAIDAKGETVIESNAGIMFVGSKTGCLEYTTALKPTVTL